MPEFTPEDVRSVTNKAEQGCGNISAELNSMVLEDRAAFAKAIQNLNAQDRASNESGASGKGVNLPKIEFTFGVDAGKTEHVLDGQCTKDPSAWVMKGKTDIYDLPAKAQVLYFAPLQMAADSIDSSSRFVKKPENQ